MHKYIFKVGKRGVFQIEIKALPLKEVDRGWYDCSDHPWYETYLVLDGVDELEDWEKIMLEKVLDYCEAIQLVEYFL